MGVIMKIIKVICILLLHVLFSQQIASAIKNRCRRSYEALYGVYEIRIIGNILIFPIKLVLSLSLAIIKIVFIWILPASVYYNIKFAIYNLIYEDITVKKIKPSIALKRVYLFFVMCVKGRQRRVSYGEKNPDKTFFVIRPYYYMKENELATSMSHLLFHYYRNLEHLSYALENHYIPVVDWENYGPFAHSESTPINGTVNCWEYYWKQPSNYTLAEVYESKNVILSMQNSHEYGYIPKAKFLSPYEKYGKDLMDKCPKYADYFRFNDITEQYIDKWEATIFPKDKKILGVSVRGVSYGGRKIPNHPIQPTILELLDEIKSKVNEWTIDYIFIACESEGVVNAVKSKFGDRVLVLPRLRYKKDSSKEYNPLYENGKRYQSNLDYVTEMALLSRCNCLLAGMSSGVRAALIWNNNKYEHFHIVEKGVW